MFASAGTSVPEVDSVLTSGEVQQLLEAHGRALGEIPSAPLDSVVPGLPNDGQLYGLPGGSGEHCMLFMYQFCASVMAETAVVISLLP